MSEDEFQKLSDAYDSSDRVAECPDHDAVVMERMEISFHIPVAMTQYQQGRFLKLINEIVSSPWNEPKAGVHWMAGVGSKPNWSRADARMLGKAPEPSAPKSGESTFDDSIYFVETYARAFVSEKERRRVLKRRTVSAVEEIP